MNIERIKNRLYVDGKLMFLEWKTILARPKQIEQVLSGNVIVKHNGKKHKGLMRKLYYKRSKEPFIYKVDLIKSYYTGVTDIHGKKYRYLDE